MEEASRPDESPDRARTTGAATSTRGVTSRPERLDFDEFYLGHHDRLVRALSLTLNDDDLGRDAASEALTRALQSWKKVSTYENPAGWVYRVGLNWARSRRRTTRREVHADISDCPGSGTVADANRPAIMAAIGCLSADHRDVVVGRYYLDWSEKQLAEALGVSSGTVKSRLHRALDRLGQLMEEDHG